MKIKCPEKKRLLEAWLTAVGRAVESTVSLSKLTADRESAEFYKASQHAKEVSDEGSLAHWHYERHTIKHGC
jgi:hypothetical protein